MDDIVPYEGFGDANNRSETLHHAMLVRTHAFTAHRTHQKPRTRTTVMASGAPH